MFQQNRLKKAEAII